MQKIIPSNFRLLNMTDFQKTKSIIELTVAK